MKFHTALEKKIYEGELKEASINEFDFIKRRRQIIKSLKDRKKSKETKKSWKVNRFKFMKGIKRFHKSTQGKRFHKDLGRFLATRDFSSLAYRECQEAVVPITSCLTHAYYELEWYMSVDEGVDYNLFLDELYDEVLSILGKLKEYKPNTEEHFEFLLRVCETSALIKSFADKYNKSEGEVEKLWNKAKDSLLGQGKKETDSNFYALLVGTLKKMLGDGSTRKRIKK
jgi:hypothetical protein